ncbi:hypothetical protein CASFOL_027130 [Castilleja foliolosa]|uniref:Zinc finger CCCH domain-containing protein 44-like n=1 Tax=Castilleja foliolosa TaxID=1961234 RepID=A0ABD3CHQ1_9LAMI
MPAAVQVDFDDETSWEYLFKVYWVILKQDLSLSLDELTQAKNPWKGVVTLGYKPLLNAIPNAFSVKVSMSYSSADNMKLNKPHVETSRLQIDGLTTNNHVEKLNKENGGDGPRPNKDTSKQETSMEKSFDDPRTEKLQDDAGTTIRDTEKRCICKHLNNKESKKPESCLGTTEWATKDLLDFVAHMKNDDTSAISLSDVQTLLLDYINRNNLWNPRRRSQIICDPRLKRLFGKPRVGHIQMLKLLGFHFLINEESQKNSLIQAGFVSSVKTDMEVDESFRSDDNSKKDEYGKPSHSVFSQNGEKPISPNKDKDEKSVQALNEMKEKTYASESSSSDKQMSEVNITNLATDGVNYQEMQRSGLETSTATAASVGNSLSSNIMEIEKLWHYRDSDSKIRGPFSMMQLREWSTTGLYPPDMRIWTNHEQYDSLPLTEAMHGKFHGASDLSNSSSREEWPTGEIGPISEGTDVSGEESNKIDTPNNVTVLSDNCTGVVRTDESGSWPHCWDFLKDNNKSCANNDVQAHNLLPPSRPENKDEAPPHCDQESDTLYNGLQNGQNNSTGLTATQIPVTAQNKSNNEDEAGQSSEEKLRSLNIDCCSHDMDLSNNNQGVNKSVLDFPSPKSAEDRQPVPSDVPVPKSGILELLSPAPRSNYDDQGGEAIETNNSGFINSPVPNPGHFWTGASGLGGGGVQISDLAEECCKFSPTVAKASVQEWSSVLASSFSLKPPEITCENITTSHSAPNLPNWLANINEPIEFDALGEESVSDLLAEVDAMESQGALQSPTSAIKFARELLEDCKDDCFSSIEEFSSVPDPRKCDALSSTSETQLNSPCKPTGPSVINAFEYLTRSNVHSSASSEVETNAATEFNPPAAPNVTQDMIGAAMGPGMGPDVVDPGWGSVQGNINLVTVQGNVNLVLGGPGHEMANLGWGANPSAGWVNPAKLNLPWDGQQRKYSGERFTNPREWGGYQGARPPWGRQPAYGGGGYSRLIPKGKRVCKFYESGHCKKGAFCDYLHP